MRHALNIQYLKTSLLSIIFSIFLLSNSFELSAYTWTCNAWNITAWSTYTCNTWYTGSTPIFYAIESTTAIADVNYNIKAQNNWAQIIFRNNNWFLGATISNLEIHYTDNIWQKWATGSTWDIGWTGATGASAYEGAVAIGYTWTIFEWIESLRWPIGATGTTQIVFATGSEIFSGAVFSLQSENDDATLNASGTYIPVFAKKEGQILVSYQWIRNIFIMVFLFFFTIFIIYKVSSWKKGL